MTHSQSHFDAEAADFMEHFCRETQDLIDEHHEERASMTFDELLEALQANPYSLELKSVAHLTHTIPLILAYMHFQDEMLSRRSWSLEKEGDISEAGFLDDLRELNRLFLQHLPAAAARAHAEAAKSRLHTMMNAFSFDSGRRTQ